MTYCAYYCFFCDQPADEHRDGSCRSCGRPVTRLVEKGEQGENDAVAAAAIRKTATQPSG